jgi:hypothetical protein
MRAWSSWHPYKRYGPFEKRNPSVSTTDQATNPMVEPANAPVDQLDEEPTISLDLDLSESEALRAWLLKPAKDGTTSLDDPLVSRALTKLGRELDAVLATVNVRHELEEAGLALDHLSDEQVRELGRRVAEAARPGMRS